MRVKLEPETAFIGKKFAYLFLGIIFTLNAITAASQINDDLHVLVIGKNADPVAKSLSEVPNVKKVIHVDNDIYENYIAENYTPVILKQAENYSHIVCSANTFGKNLMPRIAALLDTSQVSDIIKVISEDTFLRPIYAGNAFATVKSTDKKKCVTIRPTSFDPAPTSGGSAEIVKGENTDPSQNTKFVKKEEIKSDRPELGTARIVISGAIQHLAGMKESKVIVAINKDGEAPIFSVADYGLEADLFDALPKFLEELNKLNTIQK